MLASDFGKDEYLAPLPHDLLAPIPVYAPDSDPQILQRVPDALPGTNSLSNTQIGTFVFGDNNRWSFTATNGGGLVQGDPSTLTWSVVPDGTPISGFNGEPAAPSNLVSFLGGIYGVTTPDNNLTDEPWFALFESYLNRWSAVSGMTYVYEPNDDAVAISAGSNFGILGVRGDIRISGHFIDGNSNVLAYNFFPNGGDMVIDTGDANFYANTTNNSRALRNVLAHENGHGLGLDHVCPVISGPNGRLMEPFINLSIDGPQFDDILAMQRGYGDALEKNGGNDSAVRATPLGPLTVGQTIIRGADAIDTQVAPSEVDFVSIDDDSDVDFFSFTVGGGFSTTIQLMPMGASYLSGPQNSNGTCSAGTLFNASIQSDLTLQLIGADGTTVLQTSNAAGVGGTELIDSGILAAGNYFVRVSGAANAAQMYRLQLTAVQTSGVFVTPSNGELLIAESGSVDTYTLQLGSQPTGVVQITVTADNQSLVSADGVNFASTAVVSLNDTAPRTISVRAIDDAIAEGLHQSLITHAITASDDPVTYPVGLAIASLTASVLDNDLAEFVRQPTLGSFIATSDDNTGVLRNAGDQVEFTVNLQAGQTLAVTADTADAAVLSLTLVGQTSTFTAANPGGAVSMPPTQITSSDTYVIRVTGSAAARFELRAVLNAQVEVNDSSNGSELSLAGAAIEPTPGQSRWGSLGLSTPTSNPLQFVASNNPSLFVDISTTGSPLNLGDDDVAVVTSQIGNSLLPAGTITISNNGVVAAGLAPQISFANARLPTTQFATALIPFWDDLDATANGNVYWQQLKVNGIDTLIVQWQNRPHYSATGPIGSATFQVQVFASGPVLARYVYPDVDFGNGQFNSGASATVGYQSSTSSAVTYSFNTPLVGNGTVLELLSPLVPDVDEYTLDLSGLVGQRIDIALSGLTQDMSGQVLELLGPDGTTVLASGTAQPLQPGSNTTNLDVAILGTTIPTAGVYTVRVTSQVAGEYSLWIAGNATIDIEPNMEAGPWRDLEINQTAVGYLSSTTDDSDRYRVVLSAGQTISASTRTPFSGGAATPVNDLDPALTLFAADGSTQLVSSQNTASDGRNTGLTFTAPTSGTYFVSVSATGGSGEYALVVGAGVTAEQVIVNSNTWQPIFRDYIDGGFNDGIANGYRIPNGSVQTVPWLNVNQIKLPFSADVGGSLSPADFTLVGLFGYDSNFVRGVVPTIVSVSWDATQSLATLQLSGVLGPNRYDLNLLAAGIVSASGVPLASNQSFSFFYLPADPSDDHLISFNQYFVNGTDSVFVRERLSSLLLDLPGNDPFDGAYFGYDPRGDVNGDGFVNGTDSVWVRDFLQYFIIVLPTVAAPGNLLAGSAVTESLTAGSLVASSSVASTALLMDEHSVSRRRVRSRFVAEPLKTESLPSASLANTPAAALSVGARRSKLDSRFIDSVPPAIGFEKGADPLESRLASKGSDPFS